MMTRKRREESNRVVVVVLEGVKVFNDRRGVVPLRRAMHDVTGPDDEILVLTLLYMEEFETLASRPPSQLSEDDPYVRFLQQEISCKKGEFKRVFRPFYHSCKNIGVKFQVKIVAGFRPRDVIMDEARNVGASWIVMDCCFAKHFSFRLNGTDYNVSLVNDDDESAPISTSLDSSEWSEDSSGTEIPRSSKSPKLKKGSTATQERRRLDDSPSGSSIEYQPWMPSPVSQRISSEDIEQTKLDSDEASGTYRTHKSNSSISSRTTVCLGLAPLELIWEVIMEITQGFRTKLCYGRSDKHFSVYSGYLKVQENKVVVKRYQGDHSDILEAEKRAAVSLHHKNILRLLAYYRNETDTILVFSYVNGLMKERWHLKFDERLKIAVEIAQGIRYMHEECPRGPVVHGQIHISNIYLASDCRPVISGFDAAKWLQLERQDSPPPASTNRGKSEHSSDPGATTSTQTNSDVFSFGVLLLRLFCRKSAPKDDKTLVEWARPLMLQRAFHMLLDDEESGGDIHAMYRVMAAATLCTKTKPMSRPCMTQVISILKGENFCNMQSSPSECST